MKFDSVDDKREMLDDLAQGIVPLTTEPCRHDWEAGGFFGVILGVSKCKNCGRTARESDFMYGEPR